MSGYVDRMLASAERVIGPARIATPTAVAGLEEEADVPAPDMGTSAQPPALPRATAEREAMPERQPVRKQEDKTIGRSVHAASPEKTPLVRQADFLTTDSGPAQEQVRARVENPIAAAQIETGPEFRAEPAHRPVLRAQEPVPAARPAPSLAGVWVDSPQPAQLRPAAIHKPGAVPALDVRTAPAISVQEHESAKPASITLAHLSPASVPSQAIAPVPKQTVIAPMPPIADRLPKTSPPAPPPQGLVIQDLEIRIVSTQPEREPERPAPPMPAEARRPATPAGAWISAARRYAGRA
jgi:hypothetical protein